MRIYFLIACLAGTLLMTACARVNTGWDTAPVQIEVVAHETQASIGVFVPTPQGRQEVLRTTGFVGRGGVGEVKKEGDGKTPLGVFAVERAFGLAENPGTRIPYSRVTPLDVWVDDPQSRQYNQWDKSDSPYKDWQSAEKLMDEPVAYKYGAVVEYNTKKTIKGAGSAIFLHCSKNEPTSGCISLPEEDMRTLLQLLVPGTRIAIARSPQELRTIAP